MYIPAANIVEGVVIKAEARRVLQMLLVIPPQPVLTLEKHLLNVLYVTTATASKYGTTAVCIQYNS